MKSLTVVTGNSGKFSEFRDFIDAEVQLLQKDVDLIEKQTTDIFDIAGSKAVQAFEALNEPVVIDDVGIYFEEYKDFPGPFAKFVYECIGITGFERLLKEASTDRGFFRAVVAYMDSSLTQPKFFVGETKGRFSFEGKINQGQDSLPYNYIFVPERWDTTVDQNYELWKDTVNHRKKAVEKLNYFLKFGEG